MSTYCRSETGYYWITELIKVTSDKEIDVAAKEMKNNPGFKYSAREDETGRLSFYRKFTRLCEDSEVPQAQSYVEAKEREYLQAVSTEPPSGGREYVLSDDNRLLTTKELQDRFEAKIRKQSRCNHQNLTNEPCDQKYCGVLVQSWLIPTHKHACQRGFLSSYRSTCQDCDFSWEEPRAQTCDRHAT